MKHRNLREKSDLGTQESDLWFEEKMQLQQCHQKGLGKAGEQLKLRHEERRVVKYQDTIRYHLNVMVVFGSLM